MPKPSARTKTNTHSKMSDMTFHQCSQRTVVGYDEIHIFDVIVMIRGVGRNENSSNAIYVERREAN